MEVEEIKLHKVNKLVADYKSGKIQVNEKFDYTPFAKDSYIKKAEEIKKRTYKREELADVLLEMNENWNAPEAVQKNIERLKHPDSMVVIGGQQAGLLTGPVYTIHKIITLLHEAKKQEKAFKSPVIPVFWIAGEDHDFDEINHVYTAEENRMKKHTINQYQYGKKSVSDIEIDKGAAEQWLGRIFKELDETPYTKQLIQSINMVLDRSNTFVDFFAELVLELFGEEGLVLVDSGNSSLRSLESEYFKEMIIKQSSISQGVYAEIQRNMQQGYSAILEIEPNDGHIFYQLNGERVLLVKEDGYWTGKQKEVRFSEEEIIKQVEENPERFSNNVVTRPLMQELLFPSLVFVGGPGEIAYWSVLKPAFIAVGCKMPIVLPRFSFTIIDRKSSKRVSALMLNPSDAVNHGLTMERGNWLAAQEDPPIQTMTEEIKKSIERTHLPLRNVAKSMRSDLGDLADKNLQYIFNDIDFMEDRLMAAMERKYEKRLKIFDQLEQLLYPQAGLQERTWNILPWLNENGSTFLKELIDQDISIRADHYLVYL